MLGNGGGGGGAEGGGGGGWGGLGDRLICVEEKGDWRLERFGKK